MVLYKNETNNFRLQLHVVCTSNMCITDNEISLNEYRLELNNRFNKIYKLK